MSELEENPQPEEWPPVPERSIERDTSWELDLGIKWFSRIGIVALLIGFALGLSHSLPYLNEILSPQIKIMISWVVAFGLFISGTRLFSRFSLLGRILQGGGLSLGYLTLFGMFFIPEVQLFSQPPQQSIGWGLLFLYVGGMIACAKVMDSRVVAILSLAFGYYTASFSGGQLVALMATTLLSFATVLLGSQGRKWEPVRAVGLVGFVFTYLFWHCARLYMPGLTSVNHVQVLPNVTGFGDVFDESVYLCFNFLLYHWVSLAPTLLRKESADSLGLMLAGSFITYGLVLITHNGLLFGMKGLAESMLALIHLSSFGLLLLVNKETKDQTFQTQGHLLMTVVFFVLSVLALLDADMQPIGFAAGALALGLLTHSARYGAIYRVLSGVVLFAAFFSLFFLNWSLGALILIPVVGCVALAGLVLESRVFGDLDDVLRILMVLVSSGLFLAALVVSLESYWITFSIVLTGFAFLMSGFVSGRFKYRWVGLGWIFLAIFRLLTIDLLTLETPYKIVLFLALGATLLAGSYGYNLLSRRLPENRQGEQMETPVQE